MAEDWGIKSNLLVRGTSCWLKAGKDASTAKTIGFLESFRMSKSLQTVKAQVTGSIVPATIDPQAISVSVSISGFVPTKDFLSTTGATANGWDSTGFSIKSLMPDDEDFIKNQNVTKIPYMAIYDAKSGAELCEVNTVIPTQYNEAVQGGGYVKADLQFEALTMGNGSKYTESIKDFVK